MFKVSRIFSTYIFKSVISCDVKNLLEHWNAGNLLILMHEPWSTQLCLTYLIVPKSCSHVSMSLRSYQDRICTVWERLDSLSAEAFYLERLSLRIWKGSTRCTVFLCFSKLIIIIIISSLTKQSRPEVLSYT